MKEQLISLDTAKLAKEKGFDEITALVYNTYYGKIMGNINSLKHSDGDNPIISLPEQALLQKWLREEHKIIVFVNPFKDHASDLNNNEIYKYCIWNNSIGAEFKDTYEEALEIGLQEALKLI